MDAVETYEHEGVEIRIEYDGSGAGDPIADNDGWLTQCVHTHTRRNLLGEQGSRELDFNIECETCEGSGAVGPAYEDCKACEGMGTREVSPHEWLRAEHGAYGPILDLYCYEHGGMILKATEGGNPFSCPWDSGQAGWVFWTLEGIERVGAPKDDAASIIEGIKAEVSEWSDWAEGNVYGFRVDPDGEDDSCWGFVGDDGIRYAKEEAQHVAEIIARQRKEEAAERAHWAARDVETV